MRTFNVSGPNDPSRHYSLAPLARIPDVGPLLAEQSWFVVHAPRQSGKTTAMRHLAEALREGGRYAAVYASLEAARAYPEDPATAMGAILGALRVGAEGLPADCRPPVWPQTDPAYQLRPALRAWAQGSARPLVLILDEVDSLEGPTLLAVLSQLREGFSDRPQAFPSTVVLCGMRDVRDYRLPGPGGTHGASPFNVKVASFALKNFGRDEVSALVGQHAAETGQAFPEAVVDRIVGLTGGQPWLVNALAREIVMVVAPLPAPIDLDAVERAKERLVVRRDTHLDSLVARLHEPRVQRLLEPILSGDLLGPDPDYDDNLSYLRDLGLIHDQAPLRIANPIYQEIIPRVLANQAQDQLPALAGGAYRTPAGRLDIEALLEGFRSFWVAQGPAVAHGTPWPEAACQLVFMAFLQKVVNGGGQIEREYALGHGRIDVLVRWPAPQELQQEVFELKVWRDQDKRKSPLPQALAQLDGYLARLGLDQGTVVLFDRRAQADEVEDRCRIERHVTPGGRGARVLWG